MHQPRAHGTQRSTARAEEGPPAGACAAAVLHSAMGLVPVLLLLFGVRVPVAILAHPGLLLPQELGLKKVRVTGFPLNMPFTDLKSVFSAVKKTVSHRGGCDGVLRYALNAAWLAVWRRLWYRTFTRWKARRPTSSSASQYA